MDAKVVVTTDLDMDIDVGLERDLGIPIFRKIMSMVILLFSAGTKVAFYSIIQAADADAIPVDNEIISIDGPKLV